MSKGNSESDNADLSRIKHEASNWVIKQNYGFTPEEQDAFFDWIAADPEHAEMYANRRKAWKHLDVLADWRPEHSLKPNPDLLDSAHPESKRSVGKFIRWIGSMAAVLALAFGVWQIIGNSGPEKLAKGVFAESYERHVLEDGSVVELKRGAQATVAFTNGRRHVNLERGEAHFTIAKDAERPFVVVAQGIVVQAVGTMFNVQIDKDSVDVLVTEGRVMVGPKLVDEPILSVEDLGATVQELRAGQRSVINSSIVAALPQVKSASEIEIDEDLIWLKQVLEFSETPLSEIVEVFNLRNRRKMVIEDSSIKDLAVSATIQPDNIEGFVSVLELTMNIEAEKIDNSVIVLRSKD